MGLKSLDDEDYTEVIGLTGDSDGHLGITSLECDAAAMDDNDEQTADGINLGTLKEFAADYEAFGDEESDDGFDYEHLCGFTTEQPASHGGQCSCNCAVHAVDDEIVTPPKNTSSSRRRECDSTPIAKILGRPTTSSASSASDEVAQETNPEARNLKTLNSAVRQQQHYYQCKWDALSNYSETGSISEEEEETTPLDKSGSMVGLALHAEETAVARRVHDHHAPWQGTMSKPITGWPSRGARSKKNECEQNRERERWARRKQQHQHVGQGVQTDVIEKREIETQTE